MKLLGLSCGRKMGNSEILLKEAMIGAEEVGAEVTFLRMQELDIRPCIFCQPCPAMGKGMEACIYKDDAPFFLEKFLDCDGLIISVPIYTKTPPGQLFAIRDRLLGPKVDVTLVRQFRDRMGGGAKADERHFKNRAGGFIAVGGAPLPNWVTLGLPLLHTLTFSAQIAIADQMQVLRIAEIGAAVLYEEVLKRARSLGRHVAEAMGKPFDKVKYRGDEPGTCPVCHSNLMVMGRESPIMCAVCGIKGDIKVNNGRITVVFPEEERILSPLTIKGKEIHGTEVMDVAKALMPRKDEIPPKLEKYKKYKSPLKPPSKTRRRPAA
jgi:multimeric flavodoxin WrbA